MNTFTKDEATKLAGRVFVATDGLCYTATSCSTDGAVIVFDPRKNEYISFDSRETFEHWAYGTPIVTGPPAVPEPKGNAQ
jgi:hypothetical protein